MNLVKYYRLLISVVYGLRFILKGHKNMVRTMAVEPKGQFLASGSDDCTLKIWEVSTGRCVKTVEMGGVVKCVAWCPNSALSVVAVAVDTKVSYPALPRAQI